MTEEQKSVKRYSMISLAEGISFLVLLFFAMPMKYIWEIPVFVKYVGWAHGLLFVLYVVQLAYLKFEYKWELGKSTVYFIAALLPFAPFWVHKQLKKDYFN